MVPPKVLACALLSDPSREVFTCFSQSISTLLRIDGCHIAVSQRKYAFTAGTSSSTSVSGSGVRGRPVSRSGVSRGGGTASVGASSSSTRGKQSSKAAAASRGKRGAKTGKASRKVGRLCLLLLLMFCLGKKVTALLSSVSLSLPVLHHCLQRVLQDSEVEAECGEEEAMTSSLEEPPTKVRGFRSCFLLTCPEACVDGVG
mgnify:CR=1 FL=1